MPSPIYFSVQTWEIWLKTCLAANADFAIKFEGTKDDTFYRNTFKLDDMEVLLGYENTDILSDIETFELEKPTVVLWTRKGITDRGTVEKGHLTAEFQILVDTSTFDLTGYLTLFQALLDPHERTGLWLGYGLALHSCRDGEFHDGEDIHKSLKGRLYVQSVVAEFSIIGDMYDT